MYDQRFDWTYIFAAVEPATGAEFALVLPTVSTVTMSLFLTEFANTLAPDDHAVMVLDGAGWHGSAALTVPDNITLVPLPPYSPESNPVERIWLYLRERFLSLQVWPNQEAIIQACCDAWNALAADAQRIKTLCLYPWIKDGRHNTKLRHPDHAVAWHLEEISSQVAPDARAVLMMDQAGWHTTDKLAVPTNMTILSLPPRSPKLNHLAVHPPKLTVQPCLRVLRPDRRPVLPCLEQTRRSVLDHHVHRFASVGA